VKAAQLTGRGSLSDLVQIARRHLTAHQAVKTKILVSRPGWHDRSFFANHRLRDNEAVAIDYADHMDSIRVANYFASLQVKHHGYGNGCFKLGLCEERERSVKTAARLRRKGEIGTSFIYVWTLDSRQSMREFLDAGVDGIITNKPQLLDELVRRHPKVRPAQQGEPF
jgi:glycerophosphoryl diester phosphodiesterase